MIPLATLLSQTLVAFIIEFDNEFEHQVPHQTSNHGGTRGTPWLVSMVMWSQLLQFIPDEGITVRELQKNSGFPAKELRHRIIRLSRWWGYLTIQADIIRPSLNGAKAFKVWRGLSEVIEKRWEQRFGKSRLDRLRKSLDAIVKQLDPALPDSLPILGYGLYSQCTPQPARATSTIPGLISKALFAIAVECERGAPVSLAISANVLRLAPDPVKVADLPRLSGVSKEAIAMAAGFLARHGFAKIGSAAKGRAKVLMLTPSGQAAREAYIEKLTAIEKQWKKEFGADAIRDLRQTLEDMEPDLSRGLEPYPDNWRAAVAKPEALPHFPMILHRGGFPDGS